MKIFCFLIILIFTTNSNASELVLKKSTQRLQTKINSLSSNIDTSITLWLMLDTTQLVKVPVHLSEKSLQRRQRVDPQNFLIDNLDSTFAPSVIGSLTKIGVEVRHDLYWFNAITVNVSMENLSALASLPFVKKIDVVQKIRSIIKNEPIPFKESKIPAQKSLALPYGFSQFQNRYIKADKLHNAGLSGKNVRIAIFDTGFKTTHRVFDSTNIIDTYNFIDNNSDVTQDDCPNSIPQSSHGTMTFGIIGGYLPDTLIGVAYNAEFLLAKTEITCNSVEIYQEEDNWIAAAQWADLNGADIISSSLGYITFQDSAGYTFADLDGDSPRITAAADFAASKNILVINSAGNERGKSWNHIIAPSDGDSVIAVGATRPDSLLASFSSPGPTADGRIKPDISTLGTQVFTSVYTGGFTQFASGTSFSAPLVTGGVALALEHDNSLTAAELRDLIRLSGDRYDRPDNNFGYGLFDATKTANIVQFQPPFTIPLIVNQTHSFLVETDGRSDSIPVLSLVDSILGLEFVDNQDGTGRIDVLESYDFKSIQAIPIAADVGYFVDTASYFLITEALFENKLAVGPNPCSDFLNIYFYNPKNIPSVTIYNIAGEKVWELYNDFSFDADKNRIEARWSCDNQSGDNVTDGMYIIVVSDGGELFHQNVLKIK